MEKVQQWMREETPRISSSLSSVAAIRLPEYQNASEQLLSHFFSTPAKTITMFHCFLVLISGQPTCTSRSEPTPGLVLSSSSANLRSFIHFATLKSKFDNPSGELEHEAQIDLAIAIRDELADMRRVAGYFAFRSALGEVGLHEVDSRLGCVVPQDQLSSENHKVIEMATEDRPTAAIWTRNKGGLEGHKQRTGYEVGRRK